MNNQNIPIDDGLETRDGSVWSDMNSSTADLPEPHTAGDFVRFNFTSEKWVISASKEKRRTRLSKFEGELVARDCSLFEGSVEERVCIQVRERRGRHSYNTIQEIWVLRLASCTHERTRRLGLVQR